eukprot:TRINITY_DN5315_c5_g1_i1.p1 TRINITY_DN5315_c5_g1~~TRINITY_DN5315_c5_g1_i1.p1  ORF type:complete len:295 (+),score=30.79 TRINITY_DN5315_c5_g1_i1:69-953(+)
MAMLRLSMVNRGVESGRRMLHHTTPPLPPPRSGMFQKVQKSKVFRVMKWMVVPPKKEVEISKAEITYQKIKGGAWKGVAWAGKGIKVGSKWVVDQVEHNLSKEVGAGLLWGATVVAMVMCVPTLPFNVTAGAVLGVRWGVLVIASAMFVGSLINFCLAKRYFKDFATEAAALVDFAGDSESLQKNGALITFLIRLCPYFPSGAVSYGLGATSLRAHDYALGSWAGQIITVFLFTFLGSSLRKLSAETRLLHRASLRLSIGTVGVSILSITLLASTKLASSLITDLDRDMTSITA